MTTCISRRACTDRDNFKLTDKEGKKGITIWTEYRCQTAVSGSASICAACASKLPKYKYQANQKCDHGYIGGPYPADSKLYGSPYYLDKIKNGYTILESDETRAKEAITKALSEMPAKKVKPVPEALETPVDNGKKKRTIKTKAKTIIPTVETIPETTVSEQPVQMVESATPPIIASEVIIVKVKKTHIQGKDYYMDETSGKVYGLLASGVGSYKGRYNSSKEVFDTSFPDSDEE